MAKRKFRRIEPLSQINIVPYLDVMLVLLVIFMVTAPLFNQGVVDLPEAGDVALPSRAAAVEVVIQKDGEHCVPDPALNLENCGLERAEAVAAVVARRLLDPKRPVLISADRKSYLEEVVATMAALRAAGINRIGLAAQSQAK
jgi:biopolymer transport protein TolR